MLEIKEIILIGIFIAGFALFGFVRHLADKEEKEKYELQ